MKLALLNLPGVTMSVRHLLPVFLFTNLRISNCFCTKISAELKYFRYKYINNCISGKTCSGFVRIALVSTLLLLSVQINLLAEGTKQMEPNPPSGVNGYCELALFAGGMTANGYRIPFATVGCDTLYRLNVHIADPTTEIVYFGFNQKGTQPLYYRWRDPNDAVVPGYTLLINQPTAGNPGYIDTWNEAAAGPIIGALNPGGYVPLSFTPSVPGDYYLEFAADAAGNTAAWSTNNPPIIEFIDVSVYKGNTVKAGRLWSRAWQFSDVSGNYSPKTNFYVYSNDSVVTKLNVNNWKGGYYIFYCNEWGNVSTGNWYSDRQSLVAWPGDLPEFKTFLNDPDNLVYPTGSFGKICDLQTISKCDGSVEFQIKVNKAGKIDMTLDIIPFGTNTGEDVKINANVIGSPGCSTWETITWDGKDGSGNLLADGAVTNVKIDYLNGLTHMPIYDIESNTKGIMVDLVRPVPSGDSRLNIFWDDSQVAIAPNPKTNFTGCIYNAPNGCHTWPDGDLVMFNSWWYYLADMKNTSTAIKRFPATPAISVSGPTPVCSGLANVVYTILPIQYADSYVWTLPDNTTVTTATNAITLGFPTATSGGILKVHGENSNCVGIDSPPLTIIVNPTPVVTVNSGSPGVCSGGTSSIALSSNVSNTTFTWTASAPGSLSGFNNGTGNIIAQTLSNTSNAPHDVTYVITPSANGCLGAPVTITQTVQPANAVSSLPLAQTICSGTTFNMNLTATLPGTNFTWTVSGTGITGFSNGSGNLISQTLFNTTSAPASAIYQVQGTINGCTTSTTIYTVTVNNLPAQYSLAGGGEYCSGGTGVLVGITNSQTGVSYQLFNNGSPVGILLPGTGSAVDFGYQTLAGTYTVTGTRLSDVCSSSMGNSVLVAINPVPSVNAGGDFTIPHGTSTTLTGSSTGGTNPYTCSWSPVAFIATGLNTLSPNTTNLYAGTIFTLGIKDAKGCTGNDQVTVSLSGSALNITASAGSAQICNDGSQVQLFSSATGGSGVYSYTWTSIPAGSPVWTSLQQNPWVTPNTTTMYTVEVNDGYNTFTTSVQVIVNPLPIKYSLSGGGEYCSGGPGVLTGLTNSQPGVNYQLFRNGSPAGSPLPGTGSPISFGNQTLAGTYTVKGTRILTGCSADMNSSVSVSINPLPLVNAGFDFTIPHGTSTTLNGSLSGGTNPVTYSWSPAVNIAAGPVSLAPNTTNLYSSTTFTLATTDAKGCSTSDQVTVSLSGNALNITASAGSTQICNDGSQVQLFSSASGGSGLYSYTWTSIPAGSPVWTSLQQNPFVEPNTTTMYTVEVNDGYNSFSTSVLVNVNPLPLKYALSGGGEYCSGGAGVLTGLTNSQPGVNYQLYRNGSPAGSPLPGTGSAISFGNQTLAGTYTVKGTRILTGCSADMNSSVSVSINPLPLVNAGFDFTIPHGTSTSLNGSLSGGTSPITYSWSPAVNIAVGPVSLSPNTTNLYSSTTFTLAATDAKGCAASDQVTVSLSGSALNITASAGSTQICNDGSQVQLFSSASGGSGVYSYTWTSFQAGSPVWTSLQQNPFVAPNTTTMYTVEVNDGYNSFSTSVLVNVNPLPLKYALSGGGEYCSGGAGVITGLTNSQPGVNYQLYRNGSPVGLPLPGTGSGISFGNQTLAGTYSVIGTRILTGCSADMNSSVSVSINPLPLVNAGFDFIIPHGTSTTLNGSLSGGTNPVTYSWSPAVNIAMGPVSLTPNTTNLYSAETFSLSATDAKGCSASDQVTVSLSGSALNITASAGSTQICNDGSQVQLFSSASGGSGVYSYTWTSIPSGGPVWTSLQQNPFVEPITTTMYTVEVNDGYNSFSTSVLVTVNPLPLKYALSGGGEYCSGGAGVLTGLTNSQSGVNYQLYKNGSPVGLPLPGTGSPISFGNQTLAGTYTVKGTRILTGCSADMNSSVSVSINPLPLVNAGFDFTIPHGTSTTLNGSLSGGTNPITYSWSPAVNIAAGPVSLAPNTTNLYSSTTFTLAATDAKGCSASDQVTVSLSGNALNIIASASSFQLCNNGSQVQLFSSASGGSENYSYSWTSIPAGNPVWSSSQQNPTVSPTTTTIYSVVVNDGYNTETTSVTVVVNPLPAQYNLTGGGEYCNGGAGVLTGLANSQPGVNYQLYRNGSPVGLPLPGTGFPINFSSQTLAGSYTVTAIRTVTGCTANMGNNVTVSINPLPVVNAGFDFTIPHGISTTLNGTVSGGTSPYSISWSPSASIASGATTVSPQTTNLYSATTFTLGITDARGCSGNDNVTVSLSGSALTIAASASAFQICNNGSQVQLISNVSGGSGTYTFSWTKVPSGNPAWSSTQQNPWVAPNTTTMYNVEVNDGYNTATGIVNVVVNPLPTPYSLIGGGTYCSSGNGLPVWLSSSQTNTSYQLFQAGVPVGPAIYGTGNQMNFGNYTVSDVYTVMATNLTTGCVNTMSGNVNIFANPLPKIYKMDPTGQQCPGTIVRLNGSESGVNYYLLLDGIAIDSISGSGVTGFLDYGPRIASGTYTVLAVNVATGCSTLMDGSTYMNAAPEIFNVVPAGILCPGQIIRLSGSEAGVSYQLRWNTTFDFGSPVPGTGSSVDMGVGNQPGVYTAVGINDITGCVSYMNDSATLYPNPIQYTIVPDGEACEGDEISLNGSQIGVDYVLLLDNAIHIDTIHGTGSTLNFGTQFTEGNYTIIAVIQNSYCITQMTGVSVFRAAPVKKDVVPAGIICIGNAVGLAASQAGVSYQLLFNGNINVGPPVAGTGSAISFGDQILVGTYTVRAVNDLTGCNSMMTGSADLVPLPVVYRVTPAGNHCAGTNITLDGSELNFNYRLVLNGSINIDTLAGTGMALDFGPQITAGIYTIVAFSSSTFCLTDMSGTSIIDPRPEPFSLNPSSVACVGDAIGLDYSESGVTYQLRRDGTINTGIPVAGTDSAISFGSQTIPGIYSVEATGSNGCHTIMTDSVTFYPIPVPFTIVPAGIHCPGTVIKLNGSETGVNYILLRDGSFVIDTLAGTGGILDFGTPLIAGAYTIMAYSTAALCQSAMSGTTVLMMSPTAFNITPAGINCIGSAVGLDNSESGVTYQLRRDGITNIGIPVAGNGSALSFGVVNIPGAYTVTATSTLNCCGSTMNGIAVIKPLPVIYTLTLQGEQCAGVPVIVNGSQIGTDYVLIQDNTFHIDTISGTGTSIDFGPQYITGSYSVVAIAGSTTCQTRMNGSIKIIALPTAFNITPAGINCAYANVGLDGSETDITYTLYRNNTVCGSPVAGTGNAINFGVQSQNGIYKVIAVNTVSGCNSRMTDSIVLEPLPVLFSVTPAGNYCTGTSIGLNGSEKNVSYILVLNGFINLDTVSGTGKAIDFGSQIIEGNYSVVAYNPASFCRRLMNSNTAIVADPVDFALIPAGISCSGSNLGIESSQIGISYQLFWDENISIGIPLAGTGTALSFGIQHLPGTYSVKATNSLGCSITLNSTVKVSPLPNIFNLVPAGTQCQGTSLYLDGSEINTNYILVHNGNVKIDTISGNGGMISFGPQMTSGNYSVLAFYTSTHCQSRMNGITTILSQSGPALYSMTPAGVSCDSVVIGLDGSEPGTIYQLRMNGSTDVGIPVAGTGSALSFGMQKAEGVYTILNTNSNGCASTALFDVTLGQSPTADFSYTGGECDSAVSFADMSSGTKIVRWIWTFGDGKSKTIEAPEKPDFVHHYTYPGSYQVTLSTETETGCSNTITKTILRKPCLAAEFKVDDQVACVKRSLKFTESSTCQSPISTWTWYFGDGTSARFTKQQPFVVHTYAVSGIYTVKMVAATQMVGGIVTDTAISQVAVHPAAKAAYKWQDVCIGNKTIFDNQTQDNNTIITSYSWNFGDPSKFSDTSSAKHAGYTYDLSGVYNVKLVVTNTLGCTDTIINKVNIFKAPAANFTWNNSCEARPVSFTDQSEAASSDITDWNWQFRNGSELLDKSTDQNCSFTFIHEGTYDAEIKVTDKNGCSSSVDKQVIISPNPVAAFTITENYDNQQGQVMLNNGTIGGTNNYWDFGNGVTSYGENPVVSYNEEGHYNIKLLTWNDQLCTDTVTLSYDLMYKGLYVPNAFDPGHNNSEVAVFKPKGLNLKSYVLEIYDSWGNLLWKSDKLDEKGSPVEGWDGTYRGELLQADVYVWKIVAQYNDEQIWDGNNSGNNKNMPQMTAGTITLIR